MHLKYFKKVSQKTAEGAGDLIGNKMAEEITKVSRTSPYDSSGSVRNETENIGHDKELPISLHELVINLLYYEH